MRSTWSRRPVETLRSCLHASVPTLITTLVHLRAAQRLLYVTLTVYGPQLASWELVTCSCILPWPWHALPLPWEIFFFPLHAPYAEFGGECSWHRCQFYTSWEPSYGNSQWGPDPGSMPPEGHKGARTRRDRNGSEFLFKWEQDQSQDFSGSSPMLVIRGKSLHIPRIQLLSNGYS